MGLQWLRQLVLSALSLSLSSLCFTAQPASGEAIVMGQRFQIRSESMGETRSYQVHRPPHYDISNARYPVLFVLDGSEQFQQVSATVDFLSSAGKIPAMLVVGIPNTDRSRDLVGDDLAAPPSALLKFITDELVPKVDRDFRTRPYRILVGWSSAGRYTLFSMIRAPEVFRSYIAIAPAFEGDRELARSIGAFLEANRDQRLDKDVYMTLDDATGSDLTRAWELSAYFQQRVSRLRDLRFTFRRYTDESHFTVPLRSVYDGLVSIFEGWEVPDPFAFYEQVGVTGIEKHYSTLSARLGFPIPIPQGVLFDSFGQLERRNRHPEAEQVISKAIDLYPDSSTALYYAARLYKEMGNAPLAIEMLKKALLLSPNNRNARSLLGEMNIDISQIAPEVQVKETDLAKFVGGYGTSAVLFEIERRGDKLFGKTSEREYKLQALSSTIFRYDENNVYSNGGTVSFHTDGRGRVVGLTFQNGGAELEKLR